MTDMTSVYWERHTLKCTGVSGTGKRCSKCNGSANMAQRNVYALDVMLAMTNGKMECPCCSRPYDASFEVDRVTPARGYAPGAIVYICRPCNQSRGVLQSMGSDWENVTTYASDVARASERVEILPLREAMAAWQERPMGEGNQSRYA